MRNKLSIDVVFVDGKDTQYSRVGRVEQMSFDNDHYADGVLITVGGHEYSVSLEEVETVCSILREIKKKEELKNELEDPR